MATWVIDGQLARAQRPGYSGERGRPVARVEVDDWIAGLKATGIKSIICLLADDQLHLYGDLPADLVSYYRKAGLEAEHVPARDHQSPPLTEEHLGKIW